MNQKNRNMSSYICDSKHFNSIEKNLIDLIEKDDFYIPYVLKDVLPNWYNKRKSTVEAIIEELKPLINAIRELNVICVSLQYKDHYKGVLDNEITTQLENNTKKTEIKNLTLHGLYNALRCTKYQIELEHLKELRELTDIEEKSMLFLKEIIISIGKDIISKLPDDKTNTWEGN